MAKDMRILLLLLFPILAQAGGEVIRQGDLIVLKADCLAFTTGSLEASVPEGANNFGELNLNMLRNPTPAEQALCDGAPVVLPQWRVAVSGSNITRPVYELIDPLTNEKKTTDIRADVGAECENTEPTYSLKSSGGKAWRFLPNQTVNIVLCEFR